jgi:hypothetical protein
MLLHLIIPLLWYLNLSFPFIPFRKFIYGLGTACPSLKIMTISVCSFNCNRCEYVNIQIQTMQFLILGRNISPRFRGNTVRILMAQAV